MRNGYNSRQNNIDDNEESLSPAELETEKAKFWKCPECHQIVEMELSLCWNCQKKQPSEIEHPNTEEIKNEISNPGTFSPVKSGFGLITIGILVFLIERFLFTGSVVHIHKYRLVFAGFLVLAGIFFILIGMFQGKNEKGPEA